jgi:hypothetical protein
MNHVHFLAAPVRPSGLGFEAGPVAYGTRKRRGGGRWEVEADKYTQNGRASHCEGSLKGLQLSYQRFDWTYGLLCQRTKLLCTIGKENVRRYVFLFEQPLDAISWTRDIACDEIRTDRERAHTRTHTDSYSSVCAEPVVRPEQRGTRGCPRQWGSVVLGGCFVGAAR